MSYAICKHGIERIDGLGKQVCHFCELEKRIEKLENWSNTSHDSYLLTCIEQLKERIDDLEGLKEPYKDIIQGLDNRIDNLFVKPTPKESELYELLEDWLLGLGIHSKRIREEVENIRQLVIKKIGNAKGFIYQETADNIKKAIEEL